MLLLKGHRHWGWGDFINLIQTSSCQSLRDSLEVYRGLGSWLLQFDWTCFIDSLRLYQSGVVLADNTATPSAAAPIISQSASSPVAHPAAAPAGRALSDHRERERESGYTNTLQLKLQCTKLPHQHPPTLSPLVPSLLQPSGKKLDAATCQLKGCTSVQTQPHAADVWLRGSQASQCSPKTCSICSDCELWLLTIMHLCAAQLKCWWVWSRSCEMKHFSTACHNPTSWKFL